MKKRAVIALGGNALIKPGQEGTIYEQFANTRESAQVIVEMIKHGWDVVITHGNGPQVGAILLQNEQAKAVTPAMPLGICVAESEGLIGYMLQQCYANALKKEHIKKAVISIISQVLIDPKDPALSSPTKPIGPYYNARQAFQMQQEGIAMVKQPRGWRIVVPSPDPRKIVESEVIAHLLSQGVVVITAGGGGMPVCEKKGWGLDGIEAVVDKDLAAERLAETISAQLLLILTDVEYVYIDYQTKQEKKITTITRSELQQYYDQGQFPEGSMGPKVKAAIRFLQSGGKEVIITDIEHGWDAVQGKTGTHIIP